MHHMNTEISRQLVHNSACSQGTYYAKMPIACTRSCHQLMQRALVLYAIALPHTHTHTHRQNIIALHTTHNSCHDCDSLPHCRCRCCCCCWLARTALKLLLLGCLAVANPGEEFPMLVTDCSNVIIRLVWATSPWSAGPSQHALDQISC